MKKFTCFTMFAVFFIITSYSFANPCGPAEMPVKLSSGEYFVSNDTIVAMKGDPSQPITWTGDGNDWGQTNVQPYNLNGKEGVVVSGTGPDYYRWNLYQESYDRKYLRIEKAILDMPNCPNVYQPGKIAPNGYDFDGTGPAFWNVD